MKKVELEDGKIVVYTDNGKTDGKHNDITLKGEFAISAETLSYILTKLNDSTILVEGYFSERYSIISEQKAISIIKEETNFKIEAISSRNRTLEQELKSIKSKWWYKLFHSKRNGKVKSIRKWK